MPTEIIPEPDYTTRLRVRIESGAVVLALPPMYLQPLEARYLADQLIDAADAASKQEVTP